MAQTKFSGDHGVISRELNQSTLNSYSTYPQFLKGADVDFNSQSWVKTRHDLGKNPLPADEELIVRINGKRLYLLPSNLLTSKDGADYYLLDNGKLLAQGWGTDNLFPPNKAPIPIARMMRLMNCPNPEDCSISYATVEYSGGTYRSFIDHNLFPEDQPYSAYLNGEIIDLSELLDTDYGPESYFHIGWNMDEDSPIVVEVVDGNYVDKTGLSEEVLREAFNAMHEASHPDEAEQ